jgi:hypothetical protein
MNLEHRVLSWYYSIPPQKRLIVDQVIVWSVGFGAGITFAVAVIILANKLLQ